MGAAKLLTAAGGGITLDAASTATDKTITIPADNGTLVYANASGNVGIGTSSPNAIGSYPTVDIKGASGGALRVGSATYQSYVYTDAAGMTVGTGSAHPLNFFTNGTERARIDSSGNLLVGVTSDTNVPTTGVTLRNSSGTTGNIGIGHASGVTTGNPFINFAYNGGGIGSITQAGTTGVAYNTSSDYRLKENIAPMTGALSVVSQLNPVTYKWKADGSNGQGFIAHELQAVAPDCVTGEKDAVQIYIDEDGNEQTRPVYQGIDTSFLVATLTAAIQEQQALITTLTERITALEGTQQ